MGHAYTGTPRLMASVCLNFLYYDRNEPPKKTRGPHQLHHPMNHRGQLQQEERHIGRSGIMIPPGYYRALDDDGEYHLYPIMDERWEAQHKLNEQFGLALQAFALFISGLCKTQAGEEVYSRLGSSNTQDTPICDPARGNIASKTCRPFHRGEDTENITTEGIQQNKDESIESRGKSLLSTVTAKNPVTLRNAALTIWKEEAIWKKRNQGMFRENITSRTQICPTKNR